MKHSQFQGLNAEHIHEELFVQLSEGVCDGAPLIQLEKALSYVFSIHDIADKNNYQQASTIEVALILKKLGVDTETLVAALLSDMRLSDLVEQPEFEQEFNAPISNLIKHVNWMNTFNECLDVVNYLPSEAEALHRMLLATVDDVRAVLIKLAFRYKEPEQYSALAHSMAEKRSSREEFIETFVQHLQKHLT